MALVPFQTTAIAAALGAAIWAIAIPVLRGIDKIGGYKKQNRALLFGVAAASAVPTVYILKAATKTSGGDLLQVAAIGVAAACVLDGMSIGFLPKTVYATTSEGSLEPLGAALIWATGTTLAAAYVIAHRGEGTKEYSRVAVV